MNNFCTFYIVRHAQSHGNVRHIVSGQIDTNLSDEGVMQAKELGEALKEIHFDAAFSSDLTRAYETGKIIALEHQLAVTATEILRERKYGKFEGQNREALSEELQQALDRYNELSYEERKKERWIEGMETDEELIGRFTTFLRETALAYPGKTVLVVAHGNLMRTFLVHVGYGTHQELSHGMIRNTGYYVLQSDGVEFEVIKTVGVNKVEIR